MRILAIPLLVAALMAPLVAQAATDVQLTDEYRQDSCKPGSAVCHCGGRNTGISVSYTDQSGCTGICEGLGETQWQIYCTSNACTTSACEGDLDYLSGDIAYEAGAKAEEPKNDPVIPYLNVKIPGLEFTDPTQDGKYTKVSFLAQYVDALYKLLMVVCAVVAVVMIMIGGLQYILSRGNANGVKQAKERIKNAVVGMVLLMSAYSIAYLVDPSTTKFASLAIESVPKEELPVESEADIAAYGATGSIDPANVTALSGEHLINHAGSEENRVANDVLEALNTAADKFYTESAQYGTKKNLNIRVTSASRTVANQARKFYNNCIATGGVCNPGTCNPARHSNLFTKTGSKWSLAGSLAGVDTDDSATIIAAIVANGDARVCQHTNYVAVDIWPEGEGSGYIFDVEIMNVLTSVMTRNGFCRISNEPWHFELATKGSCQGNGYANSNYKTNGVSYSTAACKTWSGLSHCCKDPSDPANPPDTMCK